MINADETLWSTQQLSQKLWQNAPETGGRLHHAQIQISQIQIWSATLCLIAAVSLCGDGHNQEHGTAQPQQAIGLLVGLVTDPWLQADLSRCCTSTLNWPIKTMKTRSPNPKAIAMARTIDVSSLSWVLYINKNTLPTSSGIYFVGTDQEPSAYIGQAQCFKTRWEHVTFTISNYA